MSFFADKQTLEDLNILGRHKNNSVSRLFDATVTTGGRKLMDSMFQHPLNNAEEINKRSNIFKYFGENGISFPFTSDEFAAMENYLLVGGGSIVSVTTAAISKKILQVVMRGKDYAILNEEVCKTIGLLNRFYQFLNQRFPEQGPYSVQLEQAKRIFANPKSDWLLAERGVEQLPLLKLIKYDYLLRTGMHSDMLQLTEIIFGLDVYIAVSGVASNKGYNYAHALPGDDNVLTATGLYHPAVENAVGNPISLMQECNVIFLTGANMAGKSTLMKSFGIAVYLAHMGFPVPASSMEFSVKDGLYSSINVPDNLAMGFSHFYAEVQRVKTVAHEVASDKNLVVIFDELFKGTNVKDAYDATYAITEAFSENRNCFFVISTHIIEVGESLRANCSNFRFTYLPTLMDGPIPRYTYKLTEGITTDRHGMIIIENEGILDIIRGK